MSTIAGLSLSGAAMLPAGSPALGKGQKAAREFEAQLVGQMLGSMEKTFAELPGPGAIAGEDNYNYLGTQALASAIAAGGGFGIAKLIGQHLGVAKESAEGALPTVRKPASAG
jgi:Rod binding domain-containing protein